MLAPPIQLGLQQFLVTLHNANKTVQIACICINHDKELKPNIVKLSSLYFCSKKDLTAEYIDGKKNHEDIFNRKILILPNTSFSCVIL